MTTSINLPTKLLDYLNEARAPQPPLTEPDQPLQIDSLGLIRLVAFMENDLGIKIEDDELLADNFATPQAIANLIKSKAKTPESPAEAIDEAKSAKQTS